MSRGGNRRGWPPPWPAGAGRPHSSARPPARSASSNAPASTRAARREPERASGRQTARARRPRASRAARAGSGSAAGGWRGSCRRIPAPRCSAGTGRGPLTRWPGRRRRGRRPRCDARRVAQSPARRKKRYTRPPAGRRPRQRPGDDWPSVRALAGWSWSSLNPGRRAA